LEGSILTPVGKSHLQKWLFYLLALLVLSGCARETAPVLLSGQTMGTTWNISYVEPENAPDVDELRAGIGSLLERVNHSMSTYQPDSEISAFNALEPHIWKRVTPGFFEVLQTALEVGRQSEGAYDVTVAPLVDLWGFGAAGEITTPPAEEEIAARMKLVGEDNLRLDADTSSVMKLSALSLDFSSLAKGYGVDRVADWLEAQGITRYMVEIGGEMRLAGMSGRGDPWRIAIEQPDSTGRGVAAAINLTDTAIATSGDYRNFFEVGGRRYSHMIDPRTGRPVVHDLVSVTVVHRSCMVADAWATALTVLGEERAMAVAGKQGLAVYFIRRVGDEFIHSHTPSFSGFLAATASPGNS